MSQIRNKWPAGGTVASGSTLRKQQPPRIPPPLAVPDTQLGVTRAPAGAHRQLAGPAGPMPRRTGEQAVLIGAAVAVAVKAAEAGAFGRVGSNPDGPFQDI